METNLYAGKPSLVFPIFAIVFAILGIFTIGFIFTPLAFVCDIICTLGALKHKDSTYTVLTVFAYVLTVFAFFTSPILMAIALGLFVAILSMFHLMELNN